MLGLLDEPQWLIPNVYKFHIPPAPLAKPWLSLNDRDSFHRRCTLTKYYRETTKTIARERHIPRLDRVYITAYLSFGNNRRRDPHNFIPTTKACVDGIVDSGVLDDDNFRIVTGPDMRMDNSRPVGVHMSLYELKEASDERYDWGKGLGGEGVSGGPCD